MVEDEAWFFSFDELRKLESAGQPVKRTIGGRRVEIHFDEEGLTAWAVDPSGDRLVTVIAYEQGWLGFYPDSERFEADSQPGGR